MKLEVGMYVRTDNGIIGKIYEKIGDMFTYKDSNRDYITYGLLHSEIIKASNNIIDLIEVGDIITFKFSNDVYKVLCVPNKKVGCEDFYFEYDISQEFEDLRMKPEMVKGQIKSIVTKEQFESMKYSLEW